MTQGSDVARRGAAGRPLRELREVVAIDAGVLGRVVLLEIGLADVLDDVVLLRRDHPGLRGHLAESAGERLVEAVRVAAVLERARGEPERGRQRAGLVLGAVAVGADAAVDLLAPRVALAVEPGDHPGMVDVLLIVG